MPQINKIRIVNFTYNDGKRFIPDELYDLSSSKSKFGEALNSLFNLKNGGGKTVLVQLIMQPVHPRAMAGGRRIEEYFVRPGDHTFILLEWNLDGSKDKLLIGIAIAASVGNSSEDNQRGNQVKYYTFKTTYENYSPYSIASLELSRNENGKYIPANFDFIREKAKISKGAMECYSSEDSVKWADMLSEEYGIHRTEWETVIEALNKDEGGLNQYFSEAKTSDRLIAKFFIPAIEHKLMSVAYKETDSSLETMLINYVKKTVDKDSVFRERDNNNSLLTELEAIFSMLSELRSIKSAFVSKYSEVMGFKAALSQRASAIENEVIAINQEIENWYKLIAHVEYEEKSKAFYVAKERYARAKAALDEVNALLEKFRKALDDKKHEEDKLQCAKLYSQIQEADGRIDELKKLIEDKENNSKDSERLASLKYSVLVKARGIAKIQEEKASALGIKRENEEQALRKLEALKKKAEKEFDSARDEYNKAEANFNAAKSNTDKRIKTLQIEVTRSFVGFYPVEDIQAEKIQRQQLREELDLEVQKAERRISLIEKRRNEILIEKYKIRENIDQITRSIETAEAEINNYDSLYGELVKICVKYNLGSQSIFSEALRNSILNDIEATDIDIMSRKHEIQVLEGKKKAASEGYLHILPEIMRYVNSTGVSCKTGEDYICGLIEEGNLSNERAEKILSDYPELAYSLLFNTEREIQRLLSAGNIDWLPSAVPLFTMEQVGRIFDGSLEASSFLAVCDKTFFEDKNGYIGRITERINQLNDRIKSLEEYLREVKLEQNIASEFSYSEDWRAKLEDRIKSLQQECEALSSKQHELDKESQTLQEELVEWQKDLNKNRIEIQSIDSWLSRFSELSLMLSEEVDSYNKLQNTYGVRKKSENTYRKACEDYERCREILASLKLEQEDINASLEKTRSIIARVDNARKATLIDDELEALYSQYNTLMSNFNESLERLKYNLEAEQENRRKLEEELSAYGYEETDYRDTTFSSDLLKEVKESRRNLENEQEVTQSDFNEKNREHSSSGENVRQAQGALADYDGIPLPKGEIGDSFRSRIRNAEREIKSLQEGKDKLGREKSSLERLLYHVEDLLENYADAAINKNVILSDKPFEQWKKLKNDFKGLEKKCASKKNALNDNILNTVAKRKDNVMTEILDKLDFIRNMLKDDKFHIANESLNAIIEAIKKINSKIETDIKESENDFKDIVNQCFIQGKRMYTDLRMIANSSKTHIYDGKPQTQMLKLDIPEEREISEEASRSSIETEVRRGADELKELIKSGAEEKQIIKRAKIIVGSERLLHKYIKKEAIQVKVYKIDLNSSNSSYKRWEDTLTQSSGAEKFVSFFSVVLTLMNYTRSSSGLVSKNTKSVLILDNPFGKITSAHLLKPMFDIAKHFNVQLICFSDINKSDVISCFDCVIKLLIRNNSLSNIEIMTHENNERIEHGYYKIMNNKLFF